MSTNFFSPLSFDAVFGSGIRDPGSGMGKNQDPGSGINIPDPQHRYQYVIKLEARNFPDNQEQCSGPGSVGPRSEKFLTY
jgi:hypothetical protein